MTEEIIIDGVNVAGCISFDKNNGHNICCYDDTREDKIPFANFCVENKNCYYKQLKCLEQENKELKELNKKICEDWSKEIEVYWNALEEIRSAIVEYLPKKQGDYNFSKSLNPAEYALLEYIQIQINKVLEEKKNA